jgi:hypothetical protein
MKKWLAALALLMVLPVAWICFSGIKTGAAKTRTAAPTKSAAQQDAAVAKALAAASPQTAAVIASNFTASPQTIFYSVPTRPAIAPAGQPAPLEYTNLAPEIALDNVRTAIRGYGSRFGGNPVGVNPEIARQLSGDNPGQANFIRPEAGMRLNDQGELVDPWGTPYFFHQLSGTEMEIRSAGPDKILWTADDLMAR